MNFRQPSRDIATRIRLLLLLVSKITHIYFSFLLRARYVYLFYFIVLFAIFILHSRESELYRYTLDGKSALAWELPFSRFMGHLSST